MALLELLASCPLPGFLVTRRYDRVGRENDPGEYAVTAEVEVLKPAWSRPVWVVGIGLVGVVVLQVPGKRVLLGAVESKGSVAGEGLVGNAILVEMIEIETVGRGISWERADDPAGWRTNPRAEAKPE